MKLWRVGAMLVVLLAGQARAGEVTAADLIKEKLEIAKSREDRDIEELEMIAAARRYVAFGMIDDGKKIAAAIKDETYRQRAHLAIGKELLKRGDLAGANEMLGAIDKAQQQELGAGIMLAMAKKGQLKEAETMAAKLLDAELKGILIGQLRAMAGDTDGAQRAVDEIKKEDQQDQSRQEIAEILAERGDADAAFKFVGSIKAVHVRVDAAAECAAKYFSDGKKQQADPMLEIAREGAKDRQWARMYYWPVGHWARAEALAGKIDEARKILAELPERDMIREDAQWETVLKLTRTGQIKPAAEIAEDLTMMTRKVYFKFEVAKYLAKAGKKSEAEDALAEARFLERRSRASTEYLTEANSLEFEIWINGPAVVYARTKRYKDPEMHAAALSAILNAMQEMQESKK